MLAEKVLQIEKSIGRFGLPCKVRRGSRDTAGLPGICKRKRLVGEVDFRSGEDGSRRAGDEESGRKDAEAAWRALGALGAE